ncbi:MAG: CotH kinase family protein [Crocinitomicaceae bacterium]|nr:CotH kinase family protein [Crocinitomicaceae bacterium]
MKRTISIALALLIGTAYSMAQTFTSSHLPIVVINTGNATFNDGTIPDEPKINTNMGIIDNGLGVTNNLTDPFNAYEGIAGIETRGNSTQGYDKKTYSFELRDNTGADSSVALLGMGKEEDWILHAMVIDKTQLRIPFSFYLARQAGHYASDWRFVELVIDNDYRGTYLLCERLKRDNDRVDIAKLDADDLAGDSVTGGYILRIDWLDGDPGFESEFNSLSGDPMYYQYYYPKATNIQPAQEAYIKGYMDEFEEAVFSNTYTNTSGIRYNDYIDVTSFVDFLLINEFSKNSDGYKLSSYLHKAK